MTLTSILFAPPIYAADDTGATLISTRSGNWEDPIWAIKDTQVQAQPTENSRIIIRHAVVAFSDRSDSVITVKSVDIEPAGRLVLPGNNGHSVFNVDGVINVSGNLRILNDSVVRFLGSNETGLFVRDTGRLDLRGIEVDRRLNTPHIEHDGDHYFDFEVSGTIDAYQFIVDHSTGLKLLQKSRPISIANGLFLNTPPGPSSAFIYTEVDAVIHRISFEGGSKRPAYNVAAAPGVEVQLIDPINNSQLRNFESNGQSVIQELNTMAQNKAPQFDVSDGGLSDGAAFSDINHDGFPDLLVCNQIRSNSSERIGGCRLYVNKNGKVYEEVTQLASARIASFSHGFFLDLDRDGFPDLILYNPNEIAILINNRDLTFTDQTTQWIPFSVSGIRSVTCGDYDGDSKPDLVLSRFGYEQILIQNKGKFDLPISFDQVTDGEFAQIADIDNDGRADLLIQRPSGLQVVYQNSGTPVIQIYDSGKSSFLSLYQADLNNDGYVDFILPDRNGKFGWVKNLNSRSVKKTNESMMLIATPTEDVLQAISDQVPTSQLQLLAPQSVAVADVNGDGIPDRYFTSLRGGNGLLLGESIPGQKWLTVEFGTMGSSAIGARVKVRSGGVTQYQTIVGTQGAYSQDQPKAFFKVSGTVVDEVVVQFPSGRSYRETGISISATASVFAEESRASSARLVEGVVKYGSGTIVTGRPVQIQFYSDVATAPVLAGFEINSGHYSVNLPPNATHYSAVVTIGTTDDYLSIDLPEQPMLDGLSQDITLDFSKYSVSGLISYRGKMANNVKISFQRVSPNGTDLPNINAACTAKSGVFSTELPAGTWVPTLFFKDQFIDVLSPIAISSATTLPTINVTGNIVDTSPPTVSIGVIANSQALTGVVTIPGTVIDDLALNHVSAWIQRIDKDGRISPSINLIADTDRPVSSDAICVFSTTRFPDGLYRLFVKTDDFGGNVATGSVAFVTIQNLKADDYVHTFAGGTLDYPKSYLISVPFDQQLTLADVHLLPENVAQFDLKQQQFVSANSVNFHFSPGVGYLVSMKTGSKLNFNLTEYLPFYDPVSVEMPAGWQLIGNPFHYPVLLSSLRFVCNGTTLNYQEAVQAQCLVDGLWEWQDEISGSGYVFKNQAVTLNPWSGYWVRLLKPATIIFEPDPIRDGVFPSSARLASFFPQATRDNWYLNVQLSRDDRVVDPFNLLGVRASGLDDFDSFDVLTPPDLPNASKVPQLYFAHDDWATHSGQYLVDVRRPGDPLKTWVLTVDSGEVASPLILSLPNLSTLPAGSRAELYDRQTQTTQDLVSNPKYKFSVQSNSSYLFDLQIRTAADSIPADGLQVSGLRAFPNPFNPNSSNGRERNSLIQFRVNQNVSGSLRIYSVSGRLQRQFPVEGDRSSVIEILWDGRADSGEMLPNDVYIFILNLNDSGGHNARAKGKIVLWKK